MSYNLPKSMFYSSVYKNKRVIYFYELLYTAYKLLSARHVYEDGSWIDETGDLFDDGWNRLIKRNMAVLNERNVTLLDPNVITDAQVAYPAAHMFGDDRIVIPSYPPVIISKVIAEKHMETLWILSLNHLYFKGRGHHCPFL